MDWFDDRASRAKKCCLEVRLFYVRVSSCPLEGAPQSLTLRHQQRSVGSALELNGTYIPPLEAPALTLRRDRVDKDTAEATYVSTDTVRTTGTLDFEVCNGEQNILLCGVLEKQEDGWSMDCTSTVRSGAFLPFIKGSLKNTGSPTVEVYVAGRFSGSPLILTKVIPLYSPRRKPRRSTLDAIPEYEDTENKPKSRLLSSRPQIPELSQHEEYDEEIDPNVGNFYREGVYIEGEDGELSWFNAGVRVGVGIGLGMCLGIGIGVGLLMRTYQATTRTFRRRLL
eukprot:TRINITY_DN2241_c0_g1_i1.p1 TRINITY_DN2241_c0_g1~~TRINITY_DN2241_c0_g1_i1.p1  ORF type:complete len:282 (-),score=26.30 TRINITY_DN2241_c0_g1_i1:567-1412(-)